MIHPVSTGTMEGKGRVSRNFGCFAANQNFFSVSFFCWGFFPVEESSCIGTKL
jgi:hypothetical protein